MSDTEERLAIWLQASTPEPTRSLSAARIIDDLAASRSTLRLSNRRAWTPAFAAVAVVAVVLLVVAIAAAVRSGHQSRPAAPITTPRVTTTTLSPSVQAAAPQDFPDLRIVGSQGGDAWILSDTLSISTDGAASRSAVSLPQGIPASAISSLNVAPDGSVWLQSAHGLSIDLFRRVAGTWSRTPVLVVNPPFSGLGAPVASSFSQRGQTVAIVVGWSTGTISSLTELLLSNDGGKTFARRFTNIDYTINSVTFLSPEVGLALTGPSNDDVYRTSNGGRSWTVVLHGDAPGDTTYTAPTATASGVEVVRFSGGGGDQDVEILASTDEGASFRPTAKTDLRIPSAFSNAAMLASIAGSTVWVPGTGRIYESSDNGVTWSTISTPQSLDSLDVVSASRAIGQVSATCSSYSSKSKCLSSDYLIATTDAGKSWHSI